MMQSTVERQGDADRQGGWHVAVIMDGNGRWATRRGLPRSAGHRAGVKAVRAGGGGRPRASASRTLTLFAFSSDNWRRPDPEVRALMGLLRHYLRADLRELVENGVRLSVIGRRDRLPEGLSEEIARVEQASARRGAPRSADRHRLFGARRHHPGGGALARRAGALARGFRPAARRTAPGRRCRPGRPDVDLLIRSGGEKRLSDFLLWESAYAELCFLDTLWPDFGADELRAAMADFHRRERRFGGLCGVAQLAAAE